MLDLWIKDFFYFYNVQFLTKKVKKFYSHCKNYIVSNNNFHYIKQLYNISLIFFKPIIREFVVGFFII